MGDSRRGREIRLGSVATFWAEAMNGNFASWGCTPEVLEDLITAARDTSQVTGLTHNFYRYPARFSPKFVRAAIRAFTSPGDLIFDPFVGGGTTLVEALHLGRNALGVDISSLAAFVSEVKTTLYTERDLKIAESWAREVAHSVNIHGETPAGGAEAPPGYKRHLARPATWRLRKATEQALGAAISLSPRRLEQFARCAILRTAQWALDSRKRLPSVTEFRSALLANTLSMVQGARELRQAVEQHSMRDTPSVRCLTRSIEGIDSDPLWNEFRKPKLIITSPPYPGIHVLYHRWQVDGRKETPAPFWIANRLDGSGASYYTMGDREAQGLKPYFDKLRASLQSVARICAENTLLVQIVAFSEPSWQLPRYLSVADDAGLREVFLPTLRDSGDGRLWRTVPNRKWYADQRGRTHGSQEVVLFHRLALGSRRRSP